MDRWMAGLRIEPFVPFGARVLLAILLAHLAVMTTAPHGVLVQPEPQDERVWRFAPERGRSLAGGHQLNEDSRIADCAVTWVERSRTSPIAGGAAAPAASVGCALVGPIVRRPQHVRVPGPPPHGDRQALLQVFRE